MPASIPYVLSCMSFIAISESPIPNELGSFERIVSYLGLLVMGWFFWKRETGRTDKNLDDLKEELIIQKQENKQLERDIRALLENRKEEQGKKRRNDDQEE